MSENRFQRWNASGAYPIVCTPLWCRSELYVCRRFLAAAGLPSHRGTQPATRKKTQDLQLIGAVPLDILEELRQRKKAWRIPELTELLNLGKRTLYDEVEAGRLPAFRFGTAIRINPSDAVMWAYCFDVNAQFGNRLQRATFVFDQRR